MDVIHTCNDSTGKLKQDQGVLGQPGLQNETVSTAISTRIFKAIDG